MRYDGPDYTLYDILKRILISRGAPQEKFSKEFSKAKILPPTLSNKQSDIILDLEGTLERFKEHDVLSIDELPQDRREYYEILKSQYFRDIKKAVQAGLIYHPLVFDYAYTHNTLGNKYILRKIKRGWETGVKRPLTLTDLRFNNYLEKIAEYRIKGKSWPQIRRILMQRKIIKKMTWQALQKKFKKAWEGEFRKFGKKPPCIP